MRVMVLLRSRRNTDAGGATGSAKATRWIALSVVCVVVAGVVATAATARTGIRSVTTPATLPLQTALDDPIFLGTQRTTAFAKASLAGTSYVRLLVSWRRIAPKNLPKSGFVATDPASPYYHWTNLDATVTAAVAKHVQPIIDLTEPPTWGYSVKPGTWTGGTPNIAYLRAFATALAKRYDGAGPAPAVHAFSVWNEPNFNRNLYPQNEATYRAMVNAVATSVHAVVPSDLVLAGELAPFKHAPSKTDKNNVIPPITFMQKMLCLSTTTPVKRTCTEKAKFDVWTHHPYSDTGPFGKASAAGGVELGDLPSMDALLKTAVRLGAISTTQHTVQFWVTEIGWSSKPPNNNGVPIALETRWVAESFYQVWKSGATLGTWYLLQDKPKTTPFQSGLYSLSSSLTHAVAKPLLIPFRFPLVAYLKSGGKVLVWGKDTTNDKRTVTIQRHIGTKGSWVTVATITSNSYGIFTATLPLNAQKTWFLRAVAPGSGTSTPFSLTVPSNENLHVTPFPLNAG